MDSTPASTVYLPPGPWTTVLQALCARFPRIGRATWLTRMQRGRVLDATDAVLAVDAPFQPGMCVRYFREVADEAPIPFAEHVLHRDAHLVVADKPHFLPVNPTGAWVEQTLLRRLQRRLHLPELAPLHRIDRATAGLVLFSCNARSRSAYQALFRQRRIVKTYEALAPALPDTPLPLIRRSRLVAGEPFFRMREQAGEANSETGIDVLQADGAIWRYALHPVTGRKHQLRVHMAALGAPIINDRFYPELTAQADDDYANPLQLLARALDFVDPLNGEARNFRSELSLCQATAGAGTANSR